MSAAPAYDFSGKSREEIQRIAHAAQLLAAAKEARESFRAFVRFMLPDPEAPEDATRTAYRDTPASRLLCEIVEGIARGTKRREAISIAPQTGKTLHISQMGTAWLLGSNPRREGITATYNQIRANEIGGSVRDLMRSPRYKLVFEDVALHPEFQSKDHLQTTAGGKLTFTGMGGSITGKKADFFLVDDPIKGDDDESDVSPEALERLWKWFFKVAYSRGHKRTAIVVVHTRWQEDDLIGRLCDPDHPDRHDRYEGVADDWNYLNVPGVISDPRLAHVLKLPLVAQTNPRVVQQFGTDPIAPLDDEKSLEDYAAWKRAEPRTFSALVMGKPAPESGDYFRADWISEYRAEDLPADLMVYAASDHAVSKDKRRDFTVLGCFGVDPEDRIWVLPDVVIRRMHTDETVNEMIEMMVRNKPLWWRMEQENIAKSFGPFLIKRMHEERIYTTLMPAVSSKDKETRAQAIRGRMSHGKVFFPRFAPWWMDMRAQILRFPNGAHDDFVDFLSHIGQGMLSESAASRREEQAEKVIEVGSIEWVKAASKREERRKRMMAGAW